MKQIDHVRIEVQDVKLISKEFLTPHPTIRNRFKLLLPEGKFNGRTYYGNNMDIYFNNDRLYLNCSLPYLRHGHNYEKFDPIDTETALKDLSEILMVDIFQGLVRQYEVALILHSKIPFKNLLRTIVNVDDMELQKKSPLCWIFGNKKEQFKIYHMKKNLKKKIEPSVRHKVDLEDLNDVAKMELKVFKCRIPVMEFLENESHLAVKKLENYLVDKVNIAGEDYEGNRFDDILFRTLLNVSWNYCTYEVVHRMILDQIDAADLSPAQKSMRRKTLREKQLKINSSEAMDFFDLLEKPGDFLPF